MAPRIQDAGIGVLLAALLLLAGALVVIFSGAYDVAATDPHTRLIGWALTTTMQNSVARSADNVNAPTQFTSNMVDAGASEYKSMCSRCHGGVGAGREKWADTMLPKPPLLETAAEEWTAKEVFWIVKHGVRMSGMPAFGPTHDDETLWNIAAFVKALPGMSAETYAKYSDAHGEGEERTGHGHDDTNDHHSHDH